MILFSKIAYISAIFGVTGYLIQILMIVGCCDKHVKFQIALFKFVTVIMIMSVVSYVLYLVTK